MRSNKEFLEEIHIRGERYKAKKSRQRKAVLLSVIPVAICCVILLGNAITPVKKGTNKAADKSDQTGVYTGDYETLEDAEDIVTEDFYDDVASAQTHYPNQEYDGDYETTETQSKIHFPNQKGDGDLLAKEDAEDNNAATSTAPITKDSLAGDTQQSQSVNSKASLTSSSKTESAATNNGQLEAPEGHKEFLQKWNQVIDAENFTLTYGSDASLVNEEKAVDKMELFITEAGNNIVDYSNKSVELITIEMGGMKFKLRSGLLCNETLKENYKLNPTLISVLSNILSESNLLTDDLSRELNIISKSLLSDETVSSAAVTNGAASESAYGGE